MLYLSSMIIFAVITDQLIIAQDTVMQSSRNPTTVDTVDLVKYSGRWYEISKIPNRFQDDCVKNTTATYEITDNNQIRVINRCIDSEGEEIIAEGIARIVETSTNSKLEVSFFSILGIRPFWGDYWIIGLEEDYQYAVVGTPDRKYGWILARSKKLNPQELDQINEILIKQGYKPASFIPTPHE